MDEKKKINSTITTVNQMIKNVDKGPCGFWSEYGDDGCGNPKVLPIFKNGEKNKKDIFLPYF